MATRRSRIKAVVNIPQRRKVENVPDQSNTHEQLDVALSQPVVFDSPVDSCTVALNLQEVASSDTTHNVEVIGKSIDDVPAQEISLCKTPENGSSIIETVSVEEPGDIPALVIKQTDDVNHSFQKPLRRSLVKPKLSNKVLEQNKVKAKRLEGNSCTNSNLSDEQITNNNENEVNFDVLCDTNSNYNNLSSSNEKIKQISETDSLVKPELNPSLLVETDRDVGDGNAAEDNLSGSVITEAEAFVQEIVSNKLKHLKRIRVKPVLNQRLLKKTKQEKIIPVKEENCQDPEPNLGELTSTIEVIDSTSNSDDHISKTTDSTVVKSIINKRRVFKPTLYPRLSSKTKQDIATIDTHIELLSDDSSIVETAVNLLDELKYSDNIETQPTSCFDIIQADIVIPGASVKDDNEEVGKLLVIPANNNQLLKTEHNVLVDEQMCHSKAITNLVDSSTINQDVASDTFTAQSSVSYISTNESQKDPGLETKKPRRFVKPTVNHKLLSRQKQKVVADDTPTVQSQNSTEVTSETELVIIQKCDDQIVSNPSIAEINVDDAESIRDEKTLTGELQSTNIELKPTRRAIVKPILNKKLLAARREVLPCKTETEEDSTNIPNVLPLLPEVDFDSQSKILQYNELEIVSQSDNEMSGVEDANTFAIPLLNLKSTKVKKIDFNSDELSNLDSEHSTTVPPIKLSRGRIKVVPRLGQRRISATFHGSASESEDDIRKNYKRTRTESACSATGAQETAPNSEQECIEKKDSKVVIQRKCRRSEQSRKIAEARRNFMYKFGKGVPDKQKLTMMDLIFYNPTTEPMSQKPVQQRVKESPKDEVEPTDDKENEVIEDDDDVPAPQIKVGPNGEITIDEQSLVIENAQTRKSREELQKSDVVDGDFDTGYGVFKRVKRSKDWSKTETLYFYKALNTLGTDFTLMSEFFLGRTRRELKMKFKKEERLNSAQIDKALSQLPQFDMDELRQDFEKQKKLQEPDPETEIALKKTNEFLKKGSQIRKPKLVNTPTKRKKKKDLYSRLEKGASSLWETTSEEEDAPDIAPVLKRVAKSEKQNTKLSEADSNLDLQLANILKPTRSGRIPKRTQAFNPYSALVPQTKPKTNDNKQDFSHLEPGSLMIIAYPTPTGQPSFKVFMVTPNQNQVPITLTDDMLNNLTQSMENNTTEDETSKQLAEESINHNINENEEGNLIEPAITCT